MRFPTLHLNGTSSETLLTGYLEARAAVVVAQAALRSMEFNARDYYPQGPDAWREASNEASLRYQKLDDVANDLLVIAEEVQRQAEERNERKAGR